MKPFHYNEDPLYAIASAILAPKTIPEEAAPEEAALEEGVEDIAMAVADFKKGDKTNFGVVVDVGQHSISFKAKDLPVTKIAFNQRKMGSKDFVLDKLVKLKEGVELGEAMGMGTATITAPGHTLHGKHVSIFHKFDDGRLNVQYAKSDKKGDVLNLTLNKGQYELDEAYKVGFPLAKKAIKAATDLNPDEFKEFLGGMADYFYDVAAMDGSEPIMSRSYIVKTAVHFEQAYKGWKIK